MAKEGTALTSDSTELIRNLFVLIPLPVAIVDAGGRIVVSNSAFTDMFPGLQNIQSIRHHELELPGRGTY